MSILKNDELDDFIDPFSMCNAQNEDDDIDEINISDFQSNSKEITGRWTKEEHLSFIEGLELFGKGWKKIANLVKTRSVVQIRTHAQKYFLKLSKNKNKREQDLDHDKKIHNTTNKKKKYNIDPQDEFLSYELKLEDNINEICPQLIQMESQKNIFDEQVTFSNSLTLNTIFEENKSQFVSYLNKINNNLVESNTLSSVRNDFEKQIENIYTVYDDDYYEISSFFSSSIDDFDNAVNTDGTPPSKNNNREFHDQNTDFNLINNELFKDYCTKNENMLEHAVSSNINYDRYLENADCISEVLLKTSAY